jgi:hypothetical protein
MQKKQNIFISILENLTILMIILVLVQTFCEDLFFYLGFSLDLVNKIKLSAFIFDLYFTLEFIIRLFSALIKKRGIDYLFYKNGWIDFLASLPLLLLISGPELLYQLFAINIFSISFLSKARMLKVIKAIRVTRILRLIRVLKIFGKIKNVKSIMVQRHISKISTIVVTSIIFCLMIISILQEINLMPSKSSQLLAKEDSINNLFVKIYRSNDDKDQNSIYNYTAIEFKNVISIIISRKYKYKSENINNEYYKYYKKINNSDFIKTYQINSPPDTILITYWRMDHYKSEALTNMINFILIMFVLFSIIFIYSRHFALTISDPIYVMRMGFEIKNYTYAVKILKHYTDDDLFLLANDYNTRWLPAKVRKLSEMNVVTTKLTINDVFK